MTSQDMKNAFFKLIVDTEGNPSVSDLTALGFSEGWAVETVIRISQFSSETVRKMVLKAKEELANES